MSGRHLSSGLGFVFTMRHLKVEAQHQSEGAEAAAWTDLLRVNALLRVDGSQLLHLLQLEQQNNINQTITNPADWKQHYQNKSFFKCRSWSESWKGRTQKIRRVSSVVTQSEINTII